MIEQAGVLLRRPTVGDLDDLYEMIRESTDGMTKISREQFKDDLFGVPWRSNTHSLNTSSHHDDHLQLNMNCIRSNRPTCQSFVAEHRGDLVGYVIFHYYYSPWLGHCFFINNVFVEESYRKQGIAKKLLIEVTQLGKQENIRKVLFNSMSTDKKVMRTIRNHEVINYRDDKTDWSVCRIEFKFDRQS